MARIKIRLLVRIAMPRWFRFLSARMIVPLVD
jgi:hypothetical protein